MLDDLKKLEQILIAAGVEINIMFKPGLDRDAIIRMFNEIELVPNDSLLCLYEWHNGTNYQDIPSGKVSFTYMGGYFPLQECIRNYKDNVDIYNDYFYLFPFFHDETILIDTDSTSKTYGQLYLLCPSLLIVEPTTIYDSLEAMIQCTIKSFERGILWYDENGFLAMDHSEVSKLSKELNPNSEYWKL